MKTIDEEKDNISTWEGEGGSLNDALVTASRSHPEWSGGNGAQINSNFDRVSNALQRLAMKQPSRSRLRTFAIMLILEERRGEVLLSEKAGDFIQMDRHARPNSDNFEPRRTR